MRYQLLVIGLLGIATTTGCDWRPAGAAAADRPVGIRSGVSAASPKPAAPPPGIGYPYAGSGDWLVATRTGAVAGRAGTLLRYRVVVERDILGVDVDGFAGEVEATLSDPRGWTAGGTWRLQQVGGSLPYDFTIHLVTPATRDRLCADEPEGYTSCRNGDSVVLNVARWARGVPDYGAPLAVYRQYMVNHETGHRLGLGHVKCPGTGRPAPVMQQQTLGLHGCVANPWPYPDGRLHTGPSGTYDDPIPPAN